MKLLGFEPSQIECVFNLVHRNLVREYQGMALGGFWLVINPLILLGIYTFVFTTIFSARWPGFESPVYFAFHLFAGMVVHAWVSECITRAPTLFSQDSDLIRSVNLPWQVLPLSIVLTRAVALSMGLVILFCMSMIMGTASPVFGYLLLVLVPLGLFLYSVSFLLGIMGLYIKDLGVVTGFVSVGLLFLSPVFYSIDIVPASFQTLMWINPLTYPIEVARSVLFQQTAPGLGSIALYSGVCLGLAMLFSKMALALEAGADDVL